jgi:serine/threonine-protein kinase
VFAGVAALAVLALLVGMSGGLFADADETVPDVVGQSVASATKDVEAVDATVKTETVDEPNAKEGEVVGQSPKAGAPVPTSGPVTLQVASGRVTVPADLVGQPADEVAATLGDLGLTVKRTDVESSQTAGTVVVVDPTGRVTVGSTVTIAVAVAPVVQQTQPTQQQPQQPQQQDQGNGKKDEKQDPNDKGPGGGGPGGKDDKKP